MHCWPTHEQAAQHELQSHQTAQHAIYGLVHMQPFVTRLIDEPVTCLLLQGACEYEAD